MNKSKWRKLAVRHGKRFLAMEEERDSALADCKSEQAWAAGYNAEAGRLAKKCEEAEEWGKRTTEELKDVRAEANRLRSALGLDCVWTLRDVLVRLADATNHLLNVHDCDNQGYEIYNEALNVSKGYITKLKDLLTPAEPIIDAALAVPVETQEADDD